MRSIDDSPETGETTGNLGGCLVRQLLATLLSAALLSLLVYKFVDRSDDLILAVERIAARDLIRPFIASSAAVFLSGVRWRVLLAGMGWELSLRRCLYAVLATWPLAVVTPSRAGDLVRATLIRKKVPLLQGAASVVVEKLLDLQSIGLLLLAASLWQQQWTAALIAATGVAAFWGAFFTLPKMGPLLSRFRASRALAGHLDTLLVGLRRLHRQPGSVVTAVILSVLAWLLTLLIIHDLLRATAAGVELEPLSLAWPLSVLASALPITISGIGTRDGTLLILLQTFGATETIDEAAILTASLAYPLLTSWLYAVVGLPFMLHALRGMAGLGPTWLSRYEALVDEKPFEQAQVSSPSIENESQIRRNGDP